MIASNQADSRYRVLKIDRAPPPPASVPPIETEHDDDEGAEGLHVTEDAMIYSKEEIRELLETLSAGNVGGVTRVEALFYGIAGASQRRTVAAALANLAQQALFDSPRRTTCSSSSLGHQSLSSEVTTSTTAKPRSSSP